MGARIRELRLAQNLSQEALGLEAGVDRTMIIGIEWGKRTIAYERLWDIADVLGVHISELFETPSDNASVSPTRRGSAESSARLRKSAPPSAT
ncbi:helix-turn-helix domain-containing protein [Arthrobacter sp. SPG23]|uniref:helix-turn-helix transcriptional regulator n=1 Tax=Arthrobacter sp. SPG23 TaxID=1610703 RepID=UPI00190F7213